MSYPFLKAAKIYQGAPSGWENTFRLMLLGEAGSIRAGDHGPSSKYYRSDLAGNGWLGYCLMPPCPVPGRS